MIGRHLVLQLLQDSDALRFVLLVVAFRKEGQQRVTTLRMPESMSLWRKLLPATPLSSTAITLVREPMLAERSGLSASKAVATFPSRAPALARSRFSSSRSSTPPKNFHPPRCILEDLLCICLQFLRGPTAIAFKMLAVSMNAHMLVFSSVLTQIGCWFPVVHVKCPQQHQHT